MKQEKKLALTEQQMREIIIADRRKKKCVDVADANIRFSYRSS